MFGAARTLLHCCSCQTEVLEVSVSVEDLDISDTADIRGLTLLTEAGGVDCPVKLLLSSTVKATNLFVDSAI